MTATAQVASIFDQPHYRKHIEARGAFIRKIVPQLKSALGLHTALDVGCGLGFFAELLEESGLKVSGFDGREVNIQEARRRYPQIPFETRDIEDSEVTRLGTFDLVLCFGLLYHLESPLRAIRHLKALAGRVLFLESMCFPSDQPLVLLREEPNSDDQSLTDLAFYASEECIIKMMYRAGFAFVYRTSAMPDHDDFRTTVDHERRRTVLVGTQEPLDSPTFLLATESREAQDPWGNYYKTLPRLQKFAKKSVREKVKSVTFRLGAARERSARAIKALPRPVRLPLGFWWLARNDHVGRPLCEGTFEPNELAFVKNYLKPGMTVLDIGAHHGLYTLLASKCVGSTGKVFAFEPSPREQKSMRQHLRLNGCKNVVLEKLALGKEERQEDLYVVEEWAAGCNSLRPPDVAARTVPTPVRVMRLDNWLNNRDVGLVGFVKLDVEGAELDALRGAERFLLREPRPVILAEVQDMRTEPWGYRAKEIIEFLLQKRFRWFSLTEEGGLQPLDVTQEEFDGNFVAIPTEMEVAGS